MTFLVPLRSCFLSYHSLKQAAPGGWSLYASDKIGPNGILVAVDLLHLDSNAIRSIQDRQRQQKLQLGGFHVICGDFTTLQVKEQIIHVLDTYERKFNNDSALDQHCNKVDCIISDMACNFTGDRMTDALRTMNLCQDALLFAVGSSSFRNDREERRRVPYGDDEKINSASIDYWQDVGLLRMGGTFLCKYFSCGKEHENDLMSDAKRLFEQTIILKPPASRKQSSELYLCAIGFRGVGCTTT